MQQCSANTWEKLRLSSLLNHKTNFSYLQRGATSTLAIVTSIVTLSACKKNSESGRKDPDKPNPVTEIKSTVGPEATATTTSTVPPEAGTPLPQGSGTPLDRAALGVPPTEVTNWDVAALPSFQGELSRLVYLVSPTFGSQTIPLSDLELKAAECVNSTLNTSKIVTSAAGFTVEPGSDFVTCLKAAQPKSTTSETKNWNATWSWSIRANCSDHSFGKENGLPSSHPDVVRHLCQSASAGQLSYHVQLETKELGEGDKVLTRMVRTRALLGTTEANCSFTGNAALATRSYSGCLQFEKIERDGKTPYYLEAVFSKDKSNGLYDAKGIRFSSDSEVAVAANNWKGTVTFSTAATPTATLVLSNGTSQYELKNNFPFPPEYANNSTLYVAPSATPAPTGGPTGTPNAPSAPTQNQAP